VTIALVNESTAADNAGTSSLVATIASTTAGNLLVACVGTKDAADYVTSITGGSSSWTQAVDTGGSEGSSQQTEIWYCYNCPGGITSLTFSLNGNTRVVAHITEWSGADTTSTVFDNGASAKSSNIGTSTTPAPGSFTPSQANGIAFMCSQWANTNTTISSRPTGFTSPTNGNVESAVGSGSGIEIDVVYKIDPGTSAINESWTISSSVNWGAVACVFLEASSGINQAISASAETDSAVTVGKSESKAVGVSAETDSAIAATAVKAKAIGPSAEADSAVAVSVTKAKAIGPATETDSAVTVTDGSPKSFSDDFNRANGAVGSNWDDDGNGWSVASNKLVPGAASSTICHWVAQTSTDNNYSQITLSTIDISKSAGVVARWDGGTATAGSGYVWRAYNNEVQLYRCVSGSYTALGTPYSFTQAAGDILKIVVNGSTISGYLNGVLRQQVTDTNITTGKYVGLRGNDTSVTWDDWFGGDYVPLAAINPASETDSSVALTKSKAKAVGVPAETDAAPAITATKSWAVGAAAEADTAPALSRSKTVTIGPATETDTAVALSTPGVINQAILSAAEADAAVAVGKAKSAVAAPAAEADSAVAISKTKAVAAGSAAEADTAVAVGRVKAFTIGPATETDSAVTVTVGGAINQAILPATETDAAVALSGAKVKAIGAAVETDAAPSISRVLLGVVGAAVETDSAQSFTHAKVKQIGVAAEVDTAVAIQPPVPPMWLLTLPTYEEPVGVGRLFRRFSRNVGVSLLVNGTTVTEHIHPSQTNVANADYVYLGGHEYYLTEGAAKDILENAGYTLTLVSGSSPAPTPPAPNPTEIPITAAVEADEAPALWRPAKNKAILAAADTSFANAITHKKSVAIGTAMETDSAVSITNPNAMPLGNITGWDQIFYDDFNTDASVGNFLSTYGTNWGAYPNPWTDTSGNGTYDPSKTLYVSNSKMYIHLHTESGTCYVSAPQPKLNGSNAFVGITYGRFQFRLRVVTANDKFKLAWLLWPDSDSWPDDGEINFPEGTTTSTINAYMHYARPAGGQDAFEGSTEVFTDWHICTIEWTAGQVKFYLDGVLLGTSTSYVPSNPMHWVLQSETLVGGPAPDPADECLVEVDWVVAYAPSA